MQLYRVHRVNTSVEHSQLGRSCTSRKTFASRERLGSLLLTIVGATQLLAQPPADSIPLPETELPSALSSILPSKQQTPSSLAIQPIPDSTRSMSSTETTVDVIRLEKLPNLVESPVITALSVSPDGLWIAASGDDHAIRIVSITSGKTQTVLLGHTDWVRTVEFSPNGQNLASCSNDGTIRIWTLDNLNAGVTSKQTFMHQVGHALHTLAFSDDNTVFTAGFGNKLYRLSIAEQKLALDHICDCRDIRAMACSPNRDWIAYGGRDGILRVHSLVHPSRVSDPLRAGMESNSNTSFNTPVHYDRIRSIQFSEDGRQLISVGEDRRIVHFDIATRSIVAKNQIPGGKLMALCPVDSGVYAISGSDNAIRIFDEHQQRVLAKLVGHDGSVSILKRTNDLLISGSFDTTIRIWNINKVLSSIDDSGRFVHPVAAQFEDSGAEERVR